MAALYAQRNPAVRQISDQQWTMRLSDIPEHEAIDVVRAVDVIESAAAEEPGEVEVRALLRCGRARRTEPPAAPEALDGWLGRDWADPRATPAPQPSHTVPGAQTEIVLFADSDERVEALEAYRATWESWAAHERIALAAGEVFERLYELHGTLQRDGERFELTLADGILIWGRPNGGVRHPLILRPVRLEFEPQIPEFRIVEGDAPTEFYSALFRSMEDVDGRAIGRLSSEADALDVHPLGGAETDGFLRSVAATLSSRGTYVGTASLPPERDDPVIGRAPVFVLRRRTSGVARAIDAVVEHAMSALEFPQSLRNIVGVPDADVTNDGETSLATLIQPPALNDANADDTVLFTKPANAEQLDIARCLERDDCVLVQGPPGTGKTHTIANLLGHLLADGKSVLVVSHSTKALKVLREKVVPRLQPLCVSVLDSSGDDAALKGSIEGIVERIGSADIGRLERDAATFAAERMALVSEVRGLSAAIVSARMDEQRAVVVGGEGTAPIDAAKEVAAGAGRHDWLPTPVALGEPLTLTASEVVELYRTNGLVSPDDEKQMAQPLPVLDGFPSTHEFSAVSAEHADLRA
ncbi:MAG: AAA family ATPase, partial [Candidatus Eremiobacteraeota bacterium]|nr:AAA family ATPase [Candidatus Eremiobacteraeota bacterium]